MIIQIHILNNKLMQKKCNNNEENTYCKYLKSLLLALVKYLSIYQTKGKDLYILKNRHQ